MWARRRSSSRPQKGFVAAWLGPAALGLVSVLTVLRLPEARVASPDASGRAPLIHWKAVPIALGFLTSIVAMGGFLAFASLHAAEVGLRAASLPLFTYGAVAVGRISFAKVVDRVPSLPLGAAALTAMAAGLIVVAAWSSPAGVVVGAVLLGLGVTFSTPGFIDLGLGGGPIVLGLVASAATIPLAFVVAAAVALLGAMWTLSLRRGSPRTA